MSAIEDAVQRTAVAAHKRAHSEPIESIVGQLRGLLTPKLVAYIGGVGETRATRQWAEGQRKVSGTVEVRLRTALQAALIVSGAYDDRTAQAWMQGIDPVPDDRSPASALRDGDDADRQAVVTSARRFAIQ